MTVAANRSIGSAADVVRQCAAAGSARPHSPAGLHDSPEISAPNSTLTKSIKFEFSFDGPELPFAKQKEFESDFHRELARCETWAADQNWFSGLVPGLHVVVSDRFRISKSLVPAWSGHAGRMEFPAWRVLSRKAAIAHELIHVFFPNGNRLLAEGLAVHLQAEIGSNPAFPNFGKPLHGLVRELLPGLVPGFRPGDPASLEPVRLAELDLIATPGPLALQVGADFYGEEPRGQAHLYPLAGSFVQHLIETRGLPSFHALYGRTPLMPLHQAAGSPGRWFEIYGISLSGLESEWKAMIAGQ
jgi:hypothetical protein